MSFKAWLRKQRKRQDPVGDLARDVRADGCLRAWSYNGVKDHMLWHGACGRALDALDKAHEEYEDDQQEPGAGQRA